jgi:hypothetical protein
MDFEGADGADQPSLGTRWHRQIYEGVSIHACSHGRYGAGVAETMGWAYDHTIQ